MKNQLSSIAIAPCVAALLLIGTPGVEAKQQCSAARPSNPNGQWWSYRLIDGRKCWYAGKPMLSKALLEWRKEASAPPAIRTEVKNTEVKNKVAEKRTNPLNAQNKVAEKRANPLNAQAWAQKEDPDSFEALWRARVAVEP
jgi:hypothetical protein